MAKGPISSYRAAGVEKPQSRIECRALGRETSAWRTLEHGRSGLRVTRTYVAPCPPDHSGNEAADEEPVFLLDEVDKLGVSSG